MRRFNKKLIVRTIATILLIEGIAMLASALYGLMTREGSSAYGITASAVILTALGASGIFATKNRKIEMKARESYLIVLLCWMTAIIGGMLPFLLSGMHYGLVNSFFESAASWTTSNAWVVDIDEMPGSLVLWKAISSWLGGMGIIMLTLIVFSSLGAGGQRLAGLEVGGPKLEKQTAKISDTARMLYVVYGTGSLIEMVALKLAGLPLFDAIINTMSTISTSGTMDYQGVLSAHFNTGVKVIIGIFSILASLNFAIYIKLIKKKRRAVITDYEMNVFVGIIIGSTLLVSAILFIQGYYENIGEAAINALTGVVSFSCTTGFTLEHVDLWPSVCKFIFVLLMIIGGCATSTSGGIKIIRFAIFVKLIKRGVYKRIHPRAVKPVMIRNTPVSTEGATSASTFIMLFFGVYLLSLILFSFENLDLETTMTAPIALYTNCGVGFGQVANADFSFFSAPLRVYGALLMMLGRLEMYALLILFSRSFWTPNRAG